MRSFSLTKTNVGLTTNIKISVDSNYNLYLDSIETTSDLSYDKYKKYIINKSSYYDEVLSKFYDGLSTDISFAVKYENDNNIMSNTFDNQIDDLYIAGAKDITDNKNYAEDFEYFAPLYVSKTGLPKYFMIFRIDGPGLTTISRDNFKSEILNKLKCVKSIDLTPNTDLGQWLYNNITNNPNFPLTGFEIDHRRLQFSYWNGIDYNNGNYTKKSYFFDDILDYENSFHDLEKFIYDGYMKNSVVYPNIFNMNFLFNDTPGTPTSLRSWSLNRYSGFYLDDMILSKSVTTYLPSIVVPDCEILTGNILTSTFNKPFSDSTLKLSEIFIEILGNLYKVINVPVNIAGFQTNQWIILSDIDLTGKQALINQNIITIDSNNKISYLNGNSFTIDDWNTADVWIIKIGDKYHTLQYDNGDYYIYSDYAFTVNSTTLNYYINYPDPAYNTTIDMLTGNSWTASNVVYNTGTMSSLASFPIYKLQFTDIKYLDETIVDTHFARFEYDLSDTIIQTDEPKMHLDNLAVPDYPKSKVDFTVNNLAVNIPSASHYTANNETFRVIRDSKNNYDLNPLWRKNAEHVKWGFKNSLSANDYPYYLNNSFNAEVHNKTVDPFKTTLNRIDRNLDYFYTINSSTVSYTHHSLHIEEINNNVIDYNYYFDINQYLNLSYDYFNIFFDRKVYLNNSTNIENVSKFSQFNSGDSDTPNSTVFKGLKMNAMDVTGVNIINNQLQSITTTNNNTYDDYKFTILLSKNNFTIDTDLMDLNKISVTYSNNEMQWNIIDLWKYEKEYDINSIVNYHDILYISVTTSYINNPNINPANSTNWTYSTVNSIFWSPINAYTSYSGPSMSNIVYNSGEYYYNNGITTNTFYNPGVSYNVNDIVLYNNSVWISTTGSNTIQPNSSLLWRDSSLNPYNYWTQISFTDSFGSPIVQWSVVILWSSNNIYITGQLVIYNDILYYANSITTLGVTPDSTTDWTQLYTLTPNTNYIYNNTIDSNNLIYLNNRYYLCSSNINNSSLDNGINIFVNNKYKNILINIYINDNTLDNLSNTDRDSLYKDLYSNLSAANIINAINDVKNNYGFINKIKYIVFGDSGAYIYDFNEINSFKNLTCLLKIDTPDLIQSRVESLITTPVTLKPSQIKASAFLNNGAIPSVSKKNFYNNLHLASSIEKSRVDTEPIPNYSGLTNQIYNNLYRHSGYYDPIFLTIDLFKKGLTYSNNTIFDTELTNFGIIKESIISKVNRNGSQLKLKNSANLKSIYPQLDEFGYTTKDIFIFKSNWDLEYYLECNPVLITSTPNVMIDATVNYTPIEVTPKNLL
jgi:hypothetical protein